MAHNMRKYLDKMDDLPSSLSESSKKMRELDQKVVDTMRDIKVKTYVMINNLKKCSRESRVKAYNEIWARFQEAKKMQDEKTEMARLTYDLVDDHIKEMDKESSQFMEKHKQKFVEESDRKTQSIDIDSRKRKTATGRKDKKKGDRKQSRPTQVFENFVPLPINPVDMPVDPNEPTYCICHQVSFGEMVGCDNIDCKTEWFHFQCVGLTESPPGKWYCPDCTVQRKKK